MFENDYTITGKHATYLKYLAVKNAKEDEDATTSSARLFDRYIDVYMNAAIWGVLYSKKVERDSSSDDRARIYADAFANERDNCVFLYRMVMLLDNSVDLTPNERVDRAFRFDAQPEKTENFLKNIELFHDYVRGGIELMYEHFTDGCLTRDDYLNKVFEVVTTFKKEVDGYAYDEDLAKLIK